MARFHQEGLPGLLCELKAEMDRISERNLGRDNRLEQVNISSKSMLTYLCILLGLFVTMGLRQGIHTWTNVWLAS